MKVKNILDSNEEISIESYLKACGIEDVDLYLNPTKEVFDKPENYDNIDKAWELIKDVFDIGEK